MRKVFYPAALAISAVLLSLPGAADQPATLLKGDAMELESFSVQPPSSCLHADFSIFYQHDLAVMSVPFPSCVDPGCLDIRDSEGRKLDGQPIYITPDSYSPFTRKGKFTLTVRTSSMSPGAPWIRVKGTLPLLCGRLESLAPLEVHLPDGKEYSAPLGNSYLTRHISSTGDADQQTCATLFVQPTADAGTWLMTAAFPHGFSFAGLEFLDMENRSMTVVLSNHFFIGCAGLLSKSFLCTFPADCERIRARILYYDHIRTRAVPVDITVGPDGIKGTAEPPCLPLHES